MRNLVGVFLVNAIQRQPRESLGLRLIEIRSRHKTSLR
jgi:hypothetical protein